LGLASLVWQKKQDDVHPSLMGMRAIGALSRMGNPSLPSGSRYTLMRPERASSMASLIWTREDGATIGASGAILLIFLSFTPRQPATIIRWPRDRRVFILWVILSSVAPLTVQVFIITTSLPSSLSTNGCLPKRRALMIS